MPDPENGGYVLRILCLACRKIELLTVPVHRPPCWISSFRFHPTKSALVPFEWNTRLIKCGLAVEVLSLSWLKAEIGGVILFHLYFTSIDVKHHHHRLSSVYHATHRLDVFPQSSSCNSFSPIPTLSLVHETKSVVILRL